MQAVARKDASRRLLSGFAPLGFAAELWLAALLIVPARASAADHDLDSLPPAASMQTPTVAATVDAPVAPDSSVRVRLMGTVTLVLDRSRFVLQEGAAGILVFPRSAYPVEIGSVVEVEGKTAMQKGHLVLRDAVVRQRKRGREPEPVPLDLSRILTDAAHAALNHGRLVESDATLVENNRTTTGRSLLLQHAGGGFMTARLRGQGDGSALAEVQPGAVVRVKGICWIDLDEASEPASVELLLRNASDLVLLESPPWWNPHRAQAVAQAGVLLAAAFVAWLVTLQRRVRHQTRLIAERLEAEGSLRKQFQLFMENIPGPVFIKDAQGRYQFANAAWEQQLPERRQDWRGRTDAELWPPTIASQRAEGDMIALSSDQTLIRVESATDPQDDTRYWLSSKFGMKDTEGQRVIGGILLDITARHQAEQALRQSQDLLAKAFHASPAGIAITTCTEDRIVDANESFARVLGRARPEVLGRTWAELNLWEHEGDRTRITEDARRGQCVRDRECRLRHASGESRSVLTSVEGIELGEEPCLLWMFHDETDRLALQAQLRQAQKMESVGQLAAGVAHDFNNILTIIQGYSSLLQSMLEEEPDLQDPLRQIAGAADRAANLTRQLLTFSRRQVMQPQTVELNEILRNLSRMLQRMLGEDIALECLFGHGLPTLHADPGMLEQVLMNLAVNSRDAMPRGGQLFIRTDVIHLAGPDSARNPEARHGRFVRLTVTDTGCGMDPQTLGRIFEPFFTTKEVGKGTGLGLATVYGIVKQHRGWIEVESEPGRGTSFHIHLPPSPEPVPVPLMTAPEAAPAPKGRGTILLVEDEAPLRTLARRILEKAGYTVRETASGREALAEWPQFRGAIDLVLTDMVMPEGISGRELADALQRDKPTLRVIYTSGYSSDLVGKDCTLLEGANFLQKPYSPTSLLQAVSSCLQDGGAEPVARRP